MNSRFDPPRSAPELSIAIDRLVANELDADDRRALLLQLEADSEGWRHCALAFLEDQAWRTALAIPSSALNLLVPSASTFASPQKRRSIVPRIGRFAIAASAFGIFSFGCFQAGVSSARRVETRAILANQPSSSDQTQPILPPDPGRAIAYLDIVDPADGEALPRRVPIFEATPSNERWLESQPAAIPEYVKAQWERRGFRVEEHRRLVGLDLNDGRRGAVPVDEVAVDYVGRQPL